MNDSAVPLRLPAVSSDALPSAAAIPRSPVVSPAVRRRRAPLRRIAKYSFAAALVAVGGLATYQHVLIRVSREAVINARVVVLRAPLDGVAIVTEAMPGSGITAALAIGRVDDPHADDARVFQLQLDADATQRERDALTRRIAHWQRARAEADAQAQAYQRGRVRQDEHRVEEARAGLAAAEAREADAITALARDEALHNRGFRSDDTYERSRHAREIAYNDTVAARKRLDALIVELEAARSGTYLGDNYNDVPSSFQRARDLTIRIDEGQATLDEMARKSDVVARELAAERKRLAMRSTATITSPISGRLWARYAASGEYVRKGQDLVSILDCSAVFVTAVVSARDFNELHLGDGVRFRVAGTDREYRGSIAELGLTTASSRSFALPPTEERLHQIAVTVPELSASPQDGCAVGRTGEIVFDGATRSAPARAVEAVRRLLGHG